MTQNELLALLEERRNGTYFLGDLELGKRAAHKDRHVVERLDGTTAVVEFCDDPEKPTETVAEFGGSVAGDFEQAWRYALGAFFGPMDEEYDEEALRVLLDGQR